MILILGCRLGVLPHNRGMFLQTRDEQVAAEQEVNGDCFAEDEPPRKRGARATTLDMRRQLTQLRKGQYQLRAENTRLLEEKTQLRQGQASILQAVHQVQGTLADIMTILRPKLR